MNNPRLDKVRAVASKVKRLMDELNGLADAMADRFFRERDKELLANLKKEVEGADSRAALAAASGINDATVLDSLIASGIGPDTIASVSLIPLVAVAWADREMEASEREAILKSAAEAGIAPGSASCAILEIWLSEKPDDHLLESWIDYVSALKVQLDGVAIKQLQSSIVSRARSVAESAGGYLGLGNKVSETEKTVLTKVEAAFA